MMFAPGFGRRPRHGRLLLVPLLVALAACAGPLKPHPQDEASLGAPLPYEPPAAGLKTAPALAPVAPLVVQRGRRKLKVIALTFDACSTQGPSHFDERVIRTLVSLNVPATLFLGGKWMEEHPDETIALAGHPQFELANHTYLHPHLTQQSDVRVREELARTQDMLFTLTGRTATLFRAPYGELDARVTKLAADMGLTGVQYDLASGDPDPRITTRQLIDYVSDTAKGGSIVVMHMNGRGWKTAEALPRIIFRLRKRGYQLVTVSELLRRQAPVPAPEPRAQ
jgi:peptidoglycan/xylan/chitin deacetylase (PgdA/CDA1 family)